MSDATLEQFSCDSCSRSYAWKEQLAGKRIKCKCGEVMTVRAALAPENTDIPADDDGFDLDALARADERAVRSTASHASEARLIPMAEAVRTPRHSAAPPMGTPLGYQQGKTAAQLKRDAELKGHLSDKARNLYAPLAILIVGLGLYIGNIGYITHGAGLPIIAIGVGIISAIQAVLLIGFALCIAGPLGVSFGHPLSAALKLAAVAALSDGVTSWVGMYIAHAAAGLSYPITIPISTAIYWVGLITLFNMDSGDSWLVVTILSIVDRLLLGLILLVLGSALLGGAGSSPISLGSSASGAKHLSQTAMDVDQLKENKQWFEARKYIADGHQGSLKETVEGMYAAGAKEIGFEVLSDFSGHGSPSTLFIQMPASKEGRKQCLQLRHDYFKSLGIDRGNDDLIDDPKEDYIEIGVR